ncbi:uncharacterized protein E0L32_011661 [Thyridium curvatum]|uniref:CCZ1/INTU/HSP4 first Longin domain-containing protein n=1 Tax=Thyridium curvatum TaxID=1093900 RepID=A0A507BNT4_9PEZI|nr:uncharacterized protein E0L32_011661 [Thyridium curvatum]TPX18420.1 hypothetical protein E0L32_011661 [Thyridium curvatum]
MAAADVVPAQLGFLAIYNPSLGTTDETIEDQIVYYASVSTQNQKRRRHRARGATERPTDLLSQEERNERLRQIGLAQGMLEFGKSFSDGNPVDTIDTEKSRVILHELEPGWWLLASVDLTKLSVPAATGSSSDAKEPAARERVEYSSREVKPAALLLQDLLRAHAIFLLHHDSSLSSIFMRSKRSNFVAVLGRYWDLFLSTWSVLLHGNPVRDVFGGIKVAASGELGIGVGEEERGSGEREVLEGLVGRIEGLVDLVVAKFGPDDLESEAAGDASKQWLGTGKEPGAEDGSIFLGVGALSRKSLRDVTYWMEDMYTWGENAYGVMESPSAVRSPRKAKRSTQAASPEAQHMRPPPPVTELARRAKQPQMGTSERQTASAPESAVPLAQATPSAESSTPNEGVDKYVSYLKLGYGTYWGPGSSSAEAQSNQGQAITQPDNPVKSFAELDQGRYLIGLMGDIEEASDSEDIIPTDGPEEGFRTMLRTVSVELESEGDKRHPSQVTTSLGSQNTEVTQQSPEEEGQTQDSFNNQDRNKTKKLRVVVYINKPFIFTFMFEKRTDSLAWSGIYKSLHHQLAPLRKHLSSSTAYRPLKPDMEAAPASGSASIYDLIWDPKALTVHCTIPNIPESFAAVSESHSEPPVWNRVEALNTHMQMLNTFAATRADISELERTCKTSRGWWVVWSRILDRRMVDKKSSPRSSAITSPESEQIPSLSSETGPGSDGGSEAPEQVEEITVGKEIFLIRKASDHGGGSAVRAVSGSLISGGGGGGVGWADGATRLAQGIGVDTKRYIEGLLTLSR